MLFFACKFLRLAPEYFLEANPNSLESIQAEYQILQQPNFLQIKPNWRPFSTPPLGELLEEKPWQEFVEFVKRETKRSSLSLSPTGELSTRVEEISTCQHTTHFCS